ncbi:protein kinase domain-containing protein [Citrus sinensis]|nr:protein kinase domain-containing protein [Citrus sinensis]
MKPIKGYVRNRYRPEGCIAKCYIAEEALEFCAEYLSNCNSIGLPTSCLIDFTVERPLGGANIKVVDGPTLAQAHRCVLVNTLEIQPYIEEHLALLQSTHPRQLKKPLWLPTEHSRTFADWLKQKVVDEKVWWLANKPRSSVVTYDGYCINGFNFATRDRDSNRITQNSGVYVVANTLQISSLKDKNPHSGDMPFYGVVSEIWQLDYLGVKNVLFKCDWVDDRGVNVDELGFIVVNLDRIGYKSDCFILVSHAKQVFYVKDQLDNSKSVVCSVSSKCNYSNEDLCDGIDEYAPLSNNFPEFGKKRNDLRNYIGMIVRARVPIIYDEWRKVPLDIKETLWTHFQEKFKLSLKAKTQVFKWMGIALRGFRCKLANEYILPNANNLSSLKKPPFEYEGIRKEDWKSFVDKILSEAFQEKSKAAKEKRAKNMYNHHLGSTGYAGLLHKRLDLGVTECEIDRNEAWLLAHRRKYGTYTPEVQQVVERISELRSQVEQGTFQSQGPNDILGEALQKKPSGSRVQGLGQFITPSMYFNVPDPTELAREHRMYQESFQFMQAQLDQMNARINACNNTEVGSSNFPNSKGGCSVKMEIDRRSPSKVTPKSVTNNPKATPKSVTNNPKATPKSVTNNPNATPKSVTNNPKATPKSVTNNNPKATPKSVTKVCPKSVTNDPTVCPKPDKNINTPPLPSPAQNPPPVVCKAISKITPRRSPRLTPSKRKVDGRKSPTNAVVYLYEQKRTTKEPVVVKPVTARKLVLRKNTRGAVKARKENKSSQMNIFSLMIESSLPRTIMIAHDLKTFGVYWESRLDEHICNKVIEFTELSNSVLEIWINGHWVLVAIDMVRRKIYYLDPLGDNPDDELKQMVNEHLKALSLGSNPLGGILPPVIGNFSASFQNFYAFNCKLKGNIPQEIGNLRGLTLLSLFNNDLNGTISPTMGRLKQLRGLSLKYNNLEGSIPYDLCHLKLMYGIRLTGNKLSGHIPPCLASLTSLRELHLGSNKLTSSIPSSLWSLEYILMINLSSNSLNDSLPSNIQTLKVLRVLDLSRNQLSGDISTIGALVDLETLSLASNQFQGPIPESVGSLISLESLDLSGNNLSGKIPKSLETLSHLKQFNASHNRLEGKILVKGSFKNFSAESFFGNYALCGLPKFRVPPCKQGDSKSTKNVALIVLKYILPPIVSSVLIVIIIIMYIRCRKRSTKKSDHEDFLPLATWRRTSYLDIQRATDEFNECNLLGTGSFGSVYKGTISDWTNVAIKIFNLQLERAFRSFDSECEVLRNVCHRNLIKILSSCSNPDFKALVLEFMPNGSLENWLYSHNYFLDILERLNIMIDVGSALEYIHHDHSSAPIIHCDLKPTNILLDENMVAHVSDFGISKLLGEGEDSVIQTMTMATIGYMAPEYGSEGIVSAKCDVYSYGVLLMETFTRKRPTDEMFTGEMSLRRWVKESLPHRVSEVVDANLVREEQAFSAKMDCLLSIMDLALDCCMESPDKRMHMTDAAAKLKKIKVKFLDDVAPSS